MLSWKHTGVFVVILNDIFILFLYYFVEINFQFFSWISPIIFFYIFINLQSQQLIILTDNERVVWHDDYDRTTSAVFTLLVLKIDWFKLF